MTRTRSLFAATILALSAPVALAACGSDDDGGGDSDPQEVVDATLNNDEKITSGVMDLTVDVSAGATGEGELSLSGAFQGDADDPTAIPQLDLTAKASGEGAGQTFDFEGGLVVIEDNAFVEYNGDAYEVGTEAFEQFTAAAAAGASGAAGEDGEDAAASFQEGCSKAIEAQGGDPEACDFDIAGWFTDLTNEGTEDVEGTEAVHISGEVDVPQMFEDFAGLAESIPDAPPVPQEELDKATELIPEASFDLYSGADDDLLRKLELNLTIDPTAVESATPVPVESLDVGLSFTFSEVNEEQTIEAPADAKPIDDLVGQLGGLGALGGLGGLEGLDTGSGGGGADTSTTIPALPGGGANDAYFDCINEAGTDPDALNQCASEL